jgi:voltage-gated potassium channel
MDNKNTPEFHGIDVNALLGRQDENVSISSDLPMRKWLYSWLLDPNIPGNYQKSIDKWIVFLILANLFSMLFEHVPAVFEPHKALFHAFDIFSVAVFTVEYLVRFYLAPEDEEFKARSNPRLGYVTSPFALIDFLAVAPFYFQAFLPIDLRVLRFLRLLRILKLFRVIVPAYQEFVTLNKGRTFRQKVHALVFPSEFGGMAHSMFDTFIGLWVVVSVLAVVLESVQSIRYILNLEFVILDTVAVAIFTVEYCMRLYCCVEEPGYKGAISGRFRHARTPTAIIDFLAVLPFFLEAFLHHLFDLRFLRVFRLARLLKLTRYNDATEILFKVVVREWPVMSASAFIMMLLVVLTASLGYMFEYDAQPEKFDNIPTSIYWAVITLASVGYGDISPVTPVGRAMTIILALLGIGIFAIPAALLSSAYSDQLLKEREALKAHLYKMMMDGHIDPSEAAIIRDEAKRLHLTTAEVNTLMERIREDQEASLNRADLPIHKIAENTEHAIEHYKTLLSQIRQLGLLTDADSFEYLGREKDRLTATEWSLWQQIKGKA